MLNYKTLSYEDILDWCEEHGQLDWLEAKVKEDVKVPVYPYVEYTNSKGETRRRYDKTATPTYEVRPISFLLVKEAFVNKFMADIKPEKKKVLSMRERLQARRYGK